MRLYSRIAGGFFMGSTASFYFYKKHMYEQEMFNQINHLCRDKSGIYIQQRQAFPNWWFIQWLIPYHQSLKIVDSKTGKIRHIGLGQSPNVPSWSRSSEFVHHKGAKFDWLSRYEVSIPIEMWVDYKRRYNHFPQDEVHIDVDILNAITRCDGEEHLNEGVGVDRYKTKFLSRVTNDLGQTEFSTCRTTVLDALHKAEVMTTEKAEKAEKAENTKKAEKAEKAEKALIP